MGRYNWEMMSSGLLKIQVEVIFTGSVCVSDLCFLLIIKVISNYI